MERVPSRIPGISNRQYSALEEFNRVCLENPPAVGSSYLKEDTGRGRKRFVLVAYYPEDPTLEEVRNFKKSFRGYLIRHQKMGDFTAE